MVMPVSGYKNCVLHPFTIEQQDVILRKRPDILVNYINQYKLPEVMIHDSGYMFFRKAYEDADIDKAQHLALNTVITVLNTAHAKQTCSFIRSLEYSILPYVFLANKYCQVCIVTRYVHDTPIGPCNVATVAYTVFNSHCDVTNSHTFRNDICNMGENEGNGVLFTFSKLFYIKDHNYNIFNRDCGMIYDVRKRLFSRKKYRKNLPIFEVNLNNKHIARIQAYKYTTKDVIVYFLRSTNMEYQFKLSDHTRFSDFSMMLNCDIRFKREVNTTDEILDIMAQFVDDVDSYKVHPVTMIR